VTDREAARLARVTFGLIALLLIGAVAFAALNSSGRSPWDAPEILANSLLALSMFSFPIVGLLIATRRPRNPIGWILLAIGLTWELDALMTGYVDYGLTTHPGSVPRPDIVLALQQWLWVPGVGLVGTYLILLFPNGHLPSPRWKPLAVFAAIVLIASSLGIVFAPEKFSDSNYPQIENPLGIEALGWVWPGAYAIVLLIPVCIIGCAAGLIVRYRRSGGVERLQLKWLAAGAGASAVLYLVAMIVSIPYDWNAATSPIWVTVTQNTALFSFLLIPIAAGIAILRHGLYDIDRLINRALVYAVLMSLLALLYVGGVFAVGGLIRSVTGQENSSITVAATTLGVAALFSPIRVRVQAFVDRRFYRRKYDAARMLQEFSSMMRDQLDLDALSGQLSVAVVQALQPAHVSVWTRPSDAE
jgi:hypothetical protein